MKRKVINLKKNKLVVQDVVDCRLKSISIDGTCQNGNNTPGIIKMNEYICKSSPPFCKGMQLAQTKSSSEPQ